MKLRGAGWLIASAVTFAAFSTIAACSDSDTGAADVDGGNVALPDGGPGSADGGAKVDGGNNGGTDAGTDSGNTPTDSGPDQEVPAQCNDGKKDLGETCDPLASCPTDCPPLGCSLRALENGGTCQATCTTVATQTQCMNGDGCCPQGCSIANDSDCQATCGNGVKETGELCDGADCPKTDADCPPNGCNVRKVDGAGTCQAKCVDATPISACNLLLSDKCCPAACSSGTDLDCVAGACGNGLKEAGENCDTGIPAGQAGACATDKDCAPQQCSLFKLQNGGTCQAACTAAGTIEACLNGDGCCASGCNASNDNDCQPVCHNGATEPGETCDANCPTDPVKDCQVPGCNLYTIKNPGTCTAECAVSGQIPAGTCVNSDGCCPSGCTNANDNDCQIVPAVCGNGVKDGNETCDDSDPNPANKCPICDTKTTCNGTTGSAAACSLKCDIPITKCSSKAVDACCPLALGGGGECGSASDGDCNGTAWAFTESKAPISLAAGECGVITITNIEQGGAYDVTTCSKDVVATGDVLIKSIIGGGLIRNTTIDYGTNDNCSSKSALPIRAGLQCLNKAGVNTMACVSDGPGGFFARTTSSLKVTICGTGKGGVQGAPFGLFYNSVKVPEIGPMALP